MLNLARFFCGERGRQPLRGAWAREDQKDGCAAAEPSLRLVPRIKSGGRPEDAGVEAGPSRLYAAARLRPGCSKANRRNRAGPALRRYGGGTRPVRATQRETPPDGRDPVRLVYLATCRRLSAAIEVWFPAIDLGVSRISGRPAATLSISTAKARPRYSHMIGSLNWGNGRAWTCILSTSRLKS